MRNRNLKQVAALLAAALIFCMVVIIGCQRSTIQRLEREVHSTQTEAEYFRDWMVDCVTQDVRIHVPEPGVE